MAIPPPPDGFTLDNDHQTEDTIPPPPDGFQLDGTPNDEDHEVKNGPLGFVNGLAELAGKSVANIPYGAAHGIVDLSRRVRRNNGDTTADPDAPDPDIVQKLNVPLSQNASNVGSSIASTLGEVTPDFVRPILRNPVVRDVAGIAPAVGMARGIAGSIGRFADAPKPIVSEPEPLSAQDVVNNNAGPSGGAAATAIDASKYTPETQAEIVRAGQQQLPLNQTALERHAVGESFPIPQRLTRGMATGNGPLISEEINSRRTNPEIGQRLDDLNQGSIDNLDELRRIASPTVVGNNVVDNSQSLIDSLKRIGDSRDEAIESSYKNAKAIGGNKLTMDGQTFIDNVNAHLSDPKISEFLPGEVYRSVIAPLVNKGPENMTLDDFLASQKILGRAQRAAERSNDGNVQHALNTIRDLLENTDVAPGTAADAKAAYRSASTLAKANFDDLRANPAYKAAYEDRDITPTGNESDLNKSFAQKYILGGSRANLQRLRTAFANDPTANETMTAIALNHLRESAGIKPGFNEGNFSSDGYNSAWATKIEPRAKELLQDPQLIEQAQNIGKFAGWQQSRSRSSFVNTSNTAVADRSAATALNAGMGHAADAVTELLPLPGRVAVKVGKFYLRGRREALEKAQAEAQRQDFVRETIKPGAGLTYRSSPTDRTTRATGGRVDHEVLVNRLMNRWKQAKNATDKSTEPLLNVPDNAIARALEIAGQAI